MFAAIKKLFKKKEEEKKSTSKVVPLHPIMDKPLTPLDIARKKIYDDKVKRANEKAESLGKNYTDRLNEHLNTYFNAFSTDKEENKFAYDLINKEWKQFVQKANLMQKYIILRPNAFEVEVERIVKENKQFQLP